MLQIVGVQMTTHKSIKRGVFIKKSKGNLISDETAICENAVVGPAGRRWPPS